MNVGRLYTLVVKDEEEVSITAFVIVDGLGRILSCHMLPTKGDWMDGKLFVVYDGLLVRVPKLPTYSERDVVDEAIAMWNTQYRSRLDNEKERIQAEVQRRLAPSLN